MYVAGWKDGRAELQVYKTLQQVTRTFPEVFHGEKMTERECVDAVEDINSEGNYHDFELRLAWSWEVKS